MTGAVIAACLSVPTHSQGSLVAASSAADDDAPIAAPAPVTVPQLPAAPLVEERTAATVQRPTLSRSTSDDPGEIPDIALSAYQRAAAVIEQVDPGCGLTWSLLAAIGSIESDHGRYGGAVLGADGVSDPLILGPVLDGHGAVAAVPDTDGGLVDGNTRWDRAVGPMQILPSTWATIGVDADGDGKRSADDIDDAALGAAVFLCGAPGDLGSEAGLREALLRYNPSASYADAVTALERDYRTGAAVLPGTVDPVVVEAAGPLLPVVTDDGDAAGDDTTDDASAADEVAADHVRAGTNKPGRPHGDAGGNGGHQSQGGPSGQPATPAGDAWTPDTPAPPTTPEQPAEQPTGDPTEQPTDPTTDPTTDPEPTTQTLTGPLTDCSTDAGPAWCVGETGIDVGDATMLAAPALADLDGDGTVETNADELTGLVGTVVTVTTSVPAEGELPALLRVGELGYRDLATTTD